MSTATMPGIRAAHRVTAARSGLRYWLSSFWSMLLCEAAQARQWAAMMVFVQVMLGAGMAVVYGFFYPHVVTGLAGSFLILLAWTVAAWVLTSWVINRRE